MEAFLPVVVWSPAVGTDDTRRPAVLRRELLRYHRVPPAGQAAAAARVLPRCSVSAHRFTGSVHVIHMARLA